ncbi:MAG: hypothetical protein II064_00315, partial [Bacteroidales bacterium]|nr:hypothetical protein [Bacteroidales bacterium]
TASVEGRFPWGGIEIQLNVNEGIIRAVRVYTDAMDETLAPRLEAALQSCTFRLSDLQQRLQSLSLPQEQENQLLSILETAL